MQRLAVTLSSFALVFTMIVNIALFYQNIQLRQRASAAALAPTQAPANADQTARIALLEQRLARADQDRIKATREATAAKSQFAQLQAAAQARDSLQTQLQAAQQQNQQLRVEVGNLQAMNTINRQVAPLRNLAPLSSVPRSSMNHDQLRAHFTEVLDKEWSPAQEQRQAAILRALDLGSAQTDLRQSQIDTKTRRHEDTKG